MKEATQETKAKVAAGHKESVRRRRRNERNKERKQRQKAQKKADRKKPKRAKEGKEKERVGKSQRETLLAVCMCVCERVWAYVSLICVFSVTSRFIFLSLSASHSMKLTQNRKLSFAFRN